MEPASLFWTTYGPSIGLAAYVLAFAGIAAGCRLLATQILGTHRNLLPTVHWTERNRRRFQETQVGLALSWMMPIAGIFIVADSVARSYPHLAVAFVGSYFLLRIVVHHAARPALRATDDPNHRHRWEWPGAVVSLILLFTRGFVFSLIGTVAASIVPTHRWWIFASTLVLIVLFNARWGRFLLLAIGTLRPPNDRLRRLVAEIATRLGRPVPPCYEVRGIGLNAVAWPFWGVVGVTRPALECLDDDDVRALLLHEFGHLAEAPAIVRLRTYASLLPLVFFLGPLFRPAFPTSGALAYFISIALFVLGSMRLRVGLARTEDDADKFAANAGGAPVAYAHALEKLYRYNGYPAVQNARGLHSDLYDRMTAVGATPDYPRPEAPARRRRMVALVVAAMTFIVTATAVKVATDELVGPERSSTLLALNGWQKFRRGWIFGELARRESDTVKAGALLEQAIAADPKEPIYLMNRAMMAAQSGQCGLAGARLMQGMTALEAQEQVPASTAIWFRSLERYISEKCGGDEVARSE